YRTVRAPFFDLLVRVAESVHDFLGVLSQGWRQRSNRARSLRQLHGNSHLLHLAALGGIQFDNHFTRLNLGVGLNFVQSVHLADANVGPGQNLEPFVAGLGTKDSSEGFLDLRPSGGIVFVLDQILTAERPAKIRKKPRLDGADGDDLAVFGFVNVVVGNRAVERRLAAGGQPSVGEETRERLRHQRHRPIHHRDVDILTAAGLGAREQRGQDSNRSVHAAARVVGDEVVRDGGQLPSSSEDGKDACGSDVVEVVAHQVAVRTVLSVAGYGAVDQSVVANRHLLVADSQAFSDTGPIFLHQYVGALNHAPKNFLARSALQVEPDGFLVAIERVEGRPAEGGAGAFG